MPTPYTTWTHQAPTTPGYYWHRDEHLSVAEVTHDGEDLIATLIGEEESYSLEELGGEWQGPIVPGG